VVVIKRLSIGQRLCGGTFNSSLLLLVLVVVVV